MQVNGFMSRFSQVRRGRHALLTGLVVIYPQFPSTLLWLVHCPGKLTTVKCIIQAPSPSCDQLPGGR